MSEKELLKISGEIDSILFDLEEMTDRVLENFSKNKPKAKALMLDLAQAKKDALLLKKELNDGALM